MEIFEDQMREELEGFDVDETIELFTLNASRIGGPIGLFAPSPVVASDGSNIAPVFAGQTYEVLPFEAEGWDYSAGGTLPRPLLRFLISREDGDEVSVASYLLSLVAEFDDLIGSQVIRMETLRKFLDDGSDPNPQAHMGLHVYDVVRKSNQTPNFIEFELQSALDVEDVLLPRRQVLNYCQLAYRRPVDGGGFDYTDATCPYVGLQMFDVNEDEVFVPGQDKCSRQLRGCKARFGTNEKLPFGGFPGVGKVRV